MNWHILPINDLKEHEESSKCECNPSAEITESGDLLITHNAYDKRELVEKLLDEALKTQPDDI